MYSAGPSASEAAAFGLTLDEASGEAVEVWPDNAQAVELFLVLSTQWRPGFAGPTGLDYAALPAVFRLLAVPTSDRARLFSELRALESAALETMRQ